MDPRRDLLVPRTRAELRYWLIADLAAAGLGEWRLQQRFTRPELQYLRLRRIAEHARFGEDRGSRAVSAVRFRVLSVRLRRLGGRLRLDVPLGTAGPGVRLLGNDVTVDPAVRLPADTTLTGPVTVGPGDAATAAVDSGRRLSMSDDQVRRARDLDATGRLTREALADVFWVPVTVLERYLADGPDRQHRPPRAS